MLCNKLLKITLEKGPISFKASGPPDSSRGKYLATAVTATPGSALMAIGGTAVAALAKGRISF